MVRQAIGLWRIKTLRAREIPIPIRGMTSASLYDLRIPGSLTGLLQLLRRYASIEEYSTWVGGKIDAARLPGFLDKMEARYPALTRSFRSRCSDRQRGLARMQMVLWPIYPEQPRSERSVLKQLHAKLHPGTPTGWLWWMLSTDGRRGLCDPDSPDAHVSRDAMLAEHHITVDDYVLMYQHKRLVVPIETRTGRKRAVMRGTSTWTWSLQASVLREVRAEIDACCLRGAGVAGVLEAQRARPLFSGVRNQVIELHRYARQAVGRLNGERNQKLLDLATVLACHLPMMTAPLVYGADVQRVRDLMRAP